jgi:hypothetical protein
MLAAPTTALADGGVTSTGANFFCETSSMTEVAAGVDAAVEGVTPEPQAIFAVVAFDKNVAWGRGGDETFAKENCEKVHVVDMGGNELAQTEVYTISDKDYRQFIYIRLNDWLAPLTTYRIVVDSGIQAANGEDVSEVGYVYEFTTGAQCSNGLTIYENVLIPVVVIVFVAGVLVQVVRVRRNRR